MVHFPRGIHEPDVLFGLVEIHLGYRDFEQPDRAGHAINDTPLDRDFEQFAEHGLDDLPLRLDAVSVGGFTSVAEILLGRVVDFVEDRLESEQPDHEMLESLVGALDRVLGRLKECEALGEAAWLGAWLDLMISAQWLADQWEKRSWGAAMDLEMEKGVETQS
jgi:hypothetical protein